MSPSYATDRTVFLGSIFGGIFRSKSGGAAGTWTRLGGVGDRAVQSLLLSPRFPADPVLYVGTSDGIFKSVDAGSHWARTGPAGSSVLAISPNYRVDGTVFAGTESGLFVTRDRGSRWTELSTSPLSTSSQIVAVAVSPLYAADRTLLVSVKGRGLYRLANGGTSFTETGASLFDNNLLIADFDNPTAQPIQFSPVYGVDRTIFAMALTQRGEVDRRRSHLAEARSSPPRSSSSRRSSPPPRRRPPSRKGTPDRRRCALPSTYRIPTVPPSPWRGARSTYLTGPMSRRPGSATTSRPRAGSKFPPGATRGYVDVVTRGDTRSRTTLVVIALSGPVNARIGDGGGLGVGIIEDDDGG